MHEFAICEQLVATVLEELARMTPPKRLTCVRIAVGGMQQVVPESMEMAFDVLTQDTPAEGAKLEMRRTPVVLDCRKCGWHGEAKPNLIRCGGCSSGDVQVVSGKELYLESLEVEETPNAECRTQN